MSDLQITIIENKILQSCTYILTKYDNPNAYLIDCGEVLPILTFLKEKNKILDGILLTHCHYDHIYGLKELLLYYHNLKVFASKETFRGLDDDDLSMSYLYSDDEYIIHLKEDQIKIVDNESHFKVLDEVVKCIPTPGHDIDCTTYRIGYALFTGDSYNPNSPVFTKWRNSNADEAMKNERLLKDMITRERLIVYPGHRID